MVSVIVPAYNAANTLRRSVESILRQTHHNIEVILLNDGSTDDTRSIAETLAQQDPRVRLVSSNKNRGVLRMRNIGIRLAKGSWIAFCDADDWWIESKLAKQLHLSTAKSANLLYSAFHFAKSNGSVHTVRLRANVDYQDMLRTNAVPMSTSMYSVDALGKHYFQPLPQHLIHEDYAYWLRLFRHGNVVSAYLEEPTTYISVIKDSRSFNKLKAAYSHAAILRSEAGLPFHKMLFKLVTYAYTALKKRIPLRR